MTLINALILLCVLVVLGFVAHWLITKFFPEPVKTPALIAVGAILLVILLVQFFPGAAEYRIWK